MIEQLLQADRMLNVDQVDRAESMYQGVSDLDPANAIAVVGLARCALARGDDRRAHELASRALSIDPEDDMARRMEARLAEILTMRGEQVTRPEASSDRSARQMRPMVAGGHTGAVDQAPASKAPAHGAPGPIPGAQDRAPGGSPRSNGVTGTDRPPNAAPRGFLARLLGR